MANGGIDLGPREPGAAGIELLSRGLRDRRTDRVDLPALNRLLEALRPADILVWAWRTFGPDVVASSSFQTQSLPLLHLIASVTPEMPLVFLDTGFHFHETLAFKDRVVRELGLRTVDAEPRGGHRSFRARYGDLHRSDPDMCCYLNKIEPMERALRGASAWVTGIRRDQTTARREAEIVSRWRPGLFKICPLATWTREDVAEYRRRHDLPAHPLEGRGYRSIGCSPCTRPVQAHEDEREGRWGERSKTECGLHLLPGRRGGGS